MSILFAVVFVLGFIADPIINLYLDPWGSLVSAPHDYYGGEEDVSSTWTEHFIKGFTSMGVIGFLKVVFTSPITYFRVGRGSRGRTAGRDRYEQISWLIILIGVGTFLVVSEHLHQKNPLLILLGDVQSS
jgi:hypothetical protein